MAAIRKLKNGKYEVQVRRKGFVPVSRTFTMRNDAEQWARHMETKADRGDMPAPIKVLDGYTLKDIIERYRDEVTVKKLSADTETYLLNAILRQPIAKLTLAQLTSSHFVTYRDKRLKDVKAGTVNRELSIVKHALDIAVREWDIPIRINPLSQIKKLKVSNSRSRRLKDEEYQRLLEVIEATRNDLIKPLMNFAIETGMRRGEILRLEWKCIPATLPYSQFKEFIFGFLKNIGLDGSDGNLIKAAMRIGKTQTGLQNRGLGLDEMKDFIDRSGKGVLRIISGKGDYLYYSSGNEEVRNHKNSLEGTLIAWEIYTKNEDGLE